MTVSAFFGYLFLSWGLPLASGLPFFFHRSFLSLTTVSSMFAWLALLIVISAVFRAFVPLDDTAVGYLPLLLSTVLAEEGARAVFWYLHKSAGTHLKQLADVASVRYSQLDELALAYSVGWGHGFTHMLFQFGPFLPLTWYSATWYNSKCPNLSIFSVSVLTQLGMFALLAGVLSPRPEVRPQHHSRCECASTSVRSEIPAAKLDSCSRWHTSLTATCTAALHPCARNHT
jgi:gamma-secretase subunit APH-1